MLSWGILYVVSDFHIYFIIMFLDNVINKDQVSYFTNFASVYIEGSNNLDLYFS